MQLVWAANQGGEAMKRAMIGLMVLVCAGCGSLSGVLGVLGLSPRKVTLRLVNNTATRVQPNVYVSPSGDLLLDRVTEELLTLRINLQSFSDLGPGEAATRSYDCDGIKAVMAKNAELKIGLGLSPKEDSAIFTDGRDFRCGDTVTITYSGGVGTFRARISTSSFDPQVLIDLLGSLPISG